MSLHTDVLFAGVISSNEAAELLREFETVGLDADLREVSPRRSLSDIAWLALVTVPLKPFFDQLAKDFAHDAYKRLQTVVRKVLHGGQQAADSSRTLVLQDSITGVQVVLESDLPDEAHQQLLSFDLATIRRGPLHYDRHRRRWRSELDEIKEQVSQ